MKTFLRIVCVGIFLTVSITACTNAGGQPSQDNQGEVVTLTLAAYTTPREAYGEIIPLFKEHWREQTGQTVVFQESYLGSGAQSRAVVEGFEADVVALSLEADVNRIVEAGLITHDWKAATPNNGIVTTSIVVFAVRSGNPLGIQDWADLAQPGVEVLTPNPSTSGGAQWNILALYGAALRGYVEGGPGNDGEAAQRFLKEVLANVTVMDKAARDSITNFEQGVGDVAITYENEVLVGLQSGQNYELVIPRSTILIENPVALVDVYVDKHGTHKVAEAFIAFLFTPEVQEIYSRYGLRSINPQVAEASSDQYPPVEDLFTIDFFGGWSQATPTFFGEEGIFNQVLLEVQGGAP